WSSPKDLESGCVGPLPSRLIWMVVPGVFQRLVAVGRDALYALNDVERPRQLPAERRRSLSRVPNNRFDEFLLHRTERIRTYRSPGMDRLNYIHGCLP